MSEKILVTICNYNHEQYLKQSIESIQNQSYDNLDICIYDDGSKNKDLIRSIVNELSIDKRIRFIDEENNIGKWHGLNQAIKTSNAIICTSHDADDISLKYRIEKQYQAMKSTQTYHNLCGFYHCWNENDVHKFLNEYNNEEKLNTINKDDVYKMVMAGHSHPVIEHYFTGDFETAGVSSMFYKQIWNLGIRFNPPGKNLRTIFSEDSDFNFRVTALLNSTSILAEKHYLYRRNTSTNQELL